MTEEELKKALRDVPGADEAARAAAHAHWARLAKPLGGLGALETLVEDAAALTGPEMRKSTSAGVRYWCFAQITALLRRASARRIRA